MHYAHVNMRPDLVNVLCENGCYEYLLELDHHKNTPLQLYCNTLHVRDAYPEEYGLDPFWVKRRRQIIADLMEVTSITPRKIFDQESDALKSPRQILSELSYLDASDVENIFAHRTKSAAG